MRQYIFLLREHPYITPVIVALVIGFQAFGFVPHMTAHENYGDYWGSVIRESYLCDILDFRNDGYGHYTRAPFKYWLNCASFQLTGYPNYLPLIFNIGIMPMTYLLAVRLTNDKIIGLIALITIINIPLYSDWKYSGTYDMAWAFFMLTSIYFLYSEKKGSSILFGVSAAFKSLSIMYLPAWLYSAKQNKAWPSIIIIFILFGVVWLFVEPKTIVGNQVGFFPENTEDALVSNLTVLWNVIPFFMGLCVLYAGFKGASPKHMKDVAIWLGWILMTTPLIHMFTLQDTYGYRFVVFGAFLAIFTGQVLVRVANWYTGTKLKIPINPL